MPSETTVLPDGTTLITNEVDFGVIGAPATEVIIPVVVLPGLTTPIASGRIVHPVYGAFDYEVKPDKWVNIDADILTPPVWASTRTLGGSANVLWPGFIRDIVVEERWLALGGLAMPITQLRMFMLIWSNPVDPDVGYVEWYPNYASTFGFKVLPVDLKTGDGGIGLTDIINAKDAAGLLDGWVEDQVTFTMKIVARV